MRQIHSEDHLKGRAEIGMEVQRVLKRGLVPRYATRGLGRNDVHRSRLVGDEAHLTNQLARPKVGDRFALCLHSSPA